MAFEESSTNSQILSAESSNQYRQKNIKTTLMLVDLIKTFDFIR